MIAHIVLFEPKPDLPAEKREDFLAALRDAAREIPQIRQARVGRPIYFCLTPELSAGQLTYSYAAVLEFGTRADLEEYLRHPRHDALRAIFWETCLRTLIADVELGDLGSFTG